NQVYVSINGDGSVQVRCSTQDLGTGQRTVLAIVVAEILGLEVRQITTRIGESDIGNSTPSGGSTTCPGTAPAAYNAAVAARDNFLKAIAATLNVQAGDLSLEVGGRVLNRTNNQSLTWQQACARLRDKPAQGAGDWTAGLSSVDVGGVQV